jgi:hypothetical protein
VNETAGIDTACDNDVILKAACYGLTAALWPDPGRERQVGVLGAARYVLSRALDRATLSRDKEEVRAELAAFLDAAIALEPTEIEVSLAAEIEAAAQREALFLDTGESQLAAMTIVRAIAALETGDKRAVSALEELLDQVEALTQLAGRVRCLEQLLLTLVSGGDFAVVAEAICREPEVDKAMSICFSCYSGGSTTKELVLAGLESYIADARRNAPRVLAA